MNMTYRTRRALRRTAIVLTSILTLAIFTWVCWVVWLERYVVYSGDSAHLDFNWVMDPSKAVVAQPPETETVGLLFNEGEHTINTSSELTQIVGYYASTDNLLESVDAVDSAIKALPAGSAVVLGLKSGFGNFYYDSAVADGNLVGNLDFDKVSALIRNINLGDYYTIARISAFRDRAFGLENTHYGLAHSSGGYLWADEENCYWLNPASSGTIAYLIEIANELRELGFDEVVFTDFCFPDTTNIIFDGSRSDAIAQAAQTLVTSCATNRFAVSFETSDTSFVLPQGRSRLYLAGIDASRVQPTAESAQVTDPLINLVFFSETNDTRFDGYSVIRPMPVKEYLE